MELKLIELINSRAALNALNKISFKALYGYKVKKIIKAVNGELKTFDDLLSEKRESYFTDKEPEQEIIEQFESEMNEVVETVITLDIPKVNLSWFAKSNGAINPNTDWHDFEPAHFQTLSWLIVDDVDNK